MIEKLQIEYITDDIGEGKYSVTANATDGGVSFYRQITKAELVQKINELIDYVDYLNSQLAARKTD